MEALVDATGTLSEVLDSTCVGCSARDSVEVAASKMLGVVVAVITSVKLNDSVELADSELEATVEVGS